MQAPLMARSSARLPPTRAPRSLLMRETITEMAEGVMYALEDRPHLHVETWRPVFVRRSPEDPSTIEMFDQVGRIIDEPSISTPQGKQSLESFVEEFAENSDGFHRPPMLRRAPRDRTSKSLEASPAKEASESTDKAMQEGDKEHRDVTGQEHQERIPSHEEENHKESAPSTQMTSMRPSRIRMPIHVTHRMSRRTIHRGRCRRSRIHQSEKWSGQKMTTKRNSFPSNLLARRVLHRKERRVQLSMVQSNYFKRARASQ